MKTCHLMGWNVPLLLTSMRQLSISGVYVGAAVAPAGVGSAQLAVLPSDKPVNKSAMPRPTTQDPVKLSALLRSSREAGITGKRTSVDTPQPKVWWEFIGVAVYSGTTNRLATPDTPMAAASAAVPAPPIVCTPFQSLNITRRPP